MHASHGVEEHHRDTAVRDAVLAEVPLLHLQLHISAMYRGQPRSIPDQAFERPGRELLCVPTEFANDLADGGLPVLLP